jgi:Leucine-rich repeat (LRR) protein
MALTRYTTVAAAQKATEPAIELCLNLPKSETQLNKAFALPNLVELVLNVSKGFGEIPDSIKETKNLKHIKIEEAKNYDGKIELPTVFLELSQIEVLDIVNCPNLNIGNDSWEQMLNLKEFYVYNGGENFPQGLILAPNLSILTLSSCKYKNIPLKIGRMDSLVKVHLKLLGTTPPAAFSQLKNLKELRLDHQIPAWISKCNSGLKVLEFYPFGNVVNVDEAIFNFPDLEKLVLWGFGIKILSPKIAKLTKLRTLIIRYNKLDKLPEEIANLKQLEMVDISNNVFKSIPGVLAKLPNLKALEYKSLPLTKGEINQYHKFIEWLDLHKTQTTERDFLVDIWARKELDKASLDSKTLIKALKSKLYPLNSNALYYLTECAEKAFQTFQSGDKIYLDAKTSFKKTELKEKLSELNISLTNVFDDSVTHILINEGSTIFGSATLLTEKQLQSFINEVKPDYLVETVKENPQTLENINELLYSLSPSNIELALSLLKSGGVPEGIETALFAVYKLCEDKKLCSKALKILQHNSSFELQTAIKKRVDFKKIRYAQEYNSAISVFEGMGLDLLRFSLVFTHKFKNDAAILLILDKKDPAANKDFLMTISENGELNLNLNYYKINYIPECIYDFSHITKLRLVTNDKLASTSFKSIEKMQNLQELELDNSLKQIDMFAMPFMESLTKLTKLKKIRIHSMNAAMRSFLEQHLPNCTLQS